MITVNLETVAFRVTAAAALLKSREPNLTPGKLKQRFRDNGRYVVWGHIRGKDESGVIPYLSKKALDKDVEERKKYQAELVGVIEGRTLDAGLLMGMPPLGDGEWSLKVLKVKEAQQLATGKGVTVAILDHLFDKENPALKNRIVKPGSVVPGEPVFSSNEHGTWMAEDLVKVAPDVKIMPVRIRGKGKANDDYAGLYIKGIEYAVENGADIISLSHQPVPQERQAELDNAIEKASQKGVTFVFIHYYGNRQDVVHPGPIEFAGTERKDYIYVVGTNFINESAFPYTWGFSPTAPMVSGVIAMMKEINPHLKPVEIRQILLSSNFQQYEPGWFSLIGCLKSSQKCPRRVRQIANINIRFY